MPLLESNIVLLAEDDDDHYLITQHAFLEANLQKKLMRVKNGQELMDYLLHRGTYQNTQEFPSPLLILLDLNMPKKDGRSVLKEMQSNSELHHIPVVVLTTSINEEDKVQALHLGAKYFIQKPVLFREFVENLKKLKQYWH